MAFNSILVISYGRSGSTLLQGILNSIKGNLIRGENNNFCYSMYRAYKAISATKKHEGQLPTSPWFGSESLFISQVKAIMYYRYLVGNKTDILCYDFKEIRYTSLHIGNDLEDYLFFFKASVPKCCIHI